VDERLRLAWIENGVEGELSDEDETTGVKGSGEVEGDDDGVDS